MMRLLTFVTLLLFAAPGVGAEDPLVWPRFRGPDGSGVADGQKPPVEIGVDNNMRWKVAVPSGLSSPIIAGDNVVITAFDDGKLYTIAYGRSDGREAWRKQASAKEIEAFHKTHGSPSASTPVTDGHRIVSYFGSAGLVCYDLDGKELWKYELPAAGPGGGFGSGVSPILEDGIVILVRDATKDSRIIAIDAVNGSLKWEKDRQSPASYATPVVWDSSAGKQIVVAGHARMIAYDLTKGVEKWSVVGIPSACCSSPVIADGLLLFAGSSPGGADDKENQMPTYDSLLTGLDKDKDGALSRDEAAKTFEGFFDNQDTNKDGKVTRDEWDIVIKFISEGKNIAFALKSGGAGDVTDSHMVWKSTKGLPYVPSALVYRGQFVMVKDGGIVTAYDTKSGTEVYQARVAATGSYYASPVAANGHIYFTSLDDGVVTVLKAGTDKPDVVAKNPLGERVAATPAIADDSLYIRTDKHLYAFGEKK